MPRLSAFVARTLVLGACTLQAVGCGRAPAEQAQTVAQALDPTAKTAEPVRPVIVCLGDSLTSGLGLLVEQAYPHQLELMFKAGGYDQVDVLNAGVSGDTTAGALRRVESLLGPTTAVLVVALGGNDALRGLRTAETYENLAGIMEAAAAEGIPVLLTGMEAPTNLGDDYRDAFRATFVEVARDYRDIVTWVPFLLEGVAGQPDLNQADGIHPNEKGARMIAELLYPKLRALIDQLPPPDVQ